MRNTINAESFNRSIEIALNKSFDKEAAIGRITKRLANFPGGKLYARKDKEKITFYKVEGKRQQYIQKNSGEIYDMARRKYLELILHILKLTDCKKTTEKREREQSIEKLKHMIMRFEEGGLELAKIVLTKAQYKWYFGNYTKKRITPKEIPEAKTFTSNYQRTELGETVRSKSERDIGNALEYYAVPYHYEEKFVMDVSGLVSYLERNLIKEKKLDGSLYHYSYGVCNWNVPDTLQWMNARGSLWKTYNPYDGTVTIYVDFRYMFADSGTGAWEHEGLCDEFEYRNNASERIFLMQFTGKIPKDNLIYTFENEVNVRSVLRNIIEEEILPRLWF